MDVLRQRHRLGHAGVDEVSVGFTFLILHRVPDSFLDPRLLYVGRGQVVGHQQLVAGRALHRVVVQQPGHNVRLLPRGKGCQFKTAYINLFFLLLNVELI